VSKKKKKIKFKKKKKKKKKLTHYFLFCFLGIFYIPYSSLMDKTKLPKTVIAARPSPSSKNGSKYYKNCYKQEHLLFECPTVQCRYCHKIGHIVYNCPTKPPKPSQSGILPRPGNHSVVVAAAKESLSAPSLSSVLVSELGPLVFFMVKQFLTTSGKVSSTVSGNT
jgi:hypothetical protein